MSKYRITLFTGQSNETISYEQTFDDEMYCQADVEELVWWDCIEHAESFGHDAEYNTSIGYFLTRLG